MMRLMSCRENSRLASMAQDGQLGLGGRILLRLHTMMCAGCRAYVRQIRSLSSLLRRRLSKRGCIGKPAVLSEVERMRILEAMRKPGEGGTS